MADTDSLQNGMSQDETIKGRLEVTKGIWLPCSLKIDGFSLLVNVNFAILCNLAGNKTKKDEKTSSSSFLAVKPQKSVLKNSGSCKPENKNALFQVVTEPKVCKIKGVRTVHLRKRTIGGLGISIKGGRDAKHPDRNIPVVISKIYRDLAADESDDPGRKLFLGDIIYSVDGISLKNVSHEEAVQIFVNTEDSIVEFKAQFNYEIHRKLCDMQARERKKQGEQAEKRKKAEKLENDNRLTKFPEKTQKTSNFENLINRKFGFRNDFQDSEIENQESSTEQQQSTADILDILNTRFPNMRSQLEPNSQIVQILFPLMFAYPNEPNDNILKIDFHGQTIPDQVVFNLSTGWFAESHENG